MDTLIVADIWWSNCVLVGNTKPNYFSDPDSFTAKFYSGNETLVVQALAEAGMLPLIDPNTTQLEDILATAAMLGAREPIMAAFPKLTKAMDKTANLCWWLVLTAAQLPGHTPATSFGALVFSGDLDTVKTGLLEYQVSPYLTTPKANKLAAEFVAFTAVINDPPIPNGVKLITDLMDALCNRPISGNGWPI